MSEAGFLKGAPAHFSFLVGSDTITRERVREEIIDKLFTQNESITEERFDSTRESFQSFCERMMTPSLFQENRLFHIRHLNELLDSDLKHLINVLDMAPPDVYCICDIDLSPRRKDRQKKILDILTVKKRLKADPKMVALHEYNKPPEYKIAEWLTTQVPVFFGRNMSKNDAAFLIEFVGSELDQLYSELQKIDIHLPAGAPVNKDAIVSITGATRAKDYFELSRALGEKDFSQCLRILDSLFASTFSGPSFIYAAFRHFWALYRIRAYAAANPDKISSYRSESLPYTKRNEIAHEIGVASGLMNPNDPVGKAYPVIILSNIVNHASSYKDRHLKRVFGWLSEFDVGIKTGAREASRFEVEMLCYRIVRVKQLVDEEKP